MEYQLGLVNAAGAVVARSGVSLTAHSEAVNPAGARVASGLEHPDKANALEGHSLALLGTAADGSAIVHLIDGGVAVAQMVRQLLDRLVVLENLFHAQKKQKD